MTESEPKTKAWMHFKGAVFPVFLSRATGGLGWSELLLMTVQVC